MTKKHFILIAQSINSQRYALGMDTKEVQQALSELSLVLAGKFAEVNPNFDRTRFIDACGAGEKSAHRI